MKIFELSSNKIDFSNPAHYDGMVDSGIYVRQGTPLWEALVENCNGKKADFTLPSLPTLKEPVLTDVEILVENPTMQNEKMNCTILVKDIHVIGFSNIHVYVKCKWESLTIDRIRDIKINRII